MNASVGMNKSYLLFWVKSQGWSGQMMTHQFQDLMRFVSPEDGLGIIAYKARGCLRVHEPRKARCIPLAFRRLLKGYLCLWGWLLLSKSNLSQWRTDELISSIDVAKTSSSTSSTKLGSVHSSSFPTKSAPLAGLLAHSAEAAESQLTSARRTVRVLGRWSGSGPWAKSRRLGAWVGLMTDPKPNQKGRWDASGREGTTLGRWCPFASKSCLVKCSEKNVERERARPRDRPEKGRSWRFCISGKENGLGERRPCGYEYPGYRERSGEGLQSLGVVLWPLAGHTHGPDSPYGRLGRTVGTSEWVRVAKGHELPTARVSKGTSFPKGANQVGQSAGCHSRRKDGLVFTGCLSQGLIGFKAIRFVLGRTLMVGSRLRPETSLIGCKAIRFGLGPYSMVGSRLGVGSDEKDREPLGRTYNWSIALRS
ncbi:hypothetical protein IGI04_042860 [Brassica rapa subsp. trilocularis]|uniref:Uncharacterized protein n=1 Tax=Brassica rapa subsp. trilocularis TaxID=1813537 RepID=A0ABQ7KHC4_BRACM|nr:hypothetical protein IGI04_042860 [Brassica rapa subsp. trilocularis]